MAIVLLWEVAVRSQETRAFRKNRPILTLVPWSARVPLDPLLPNGSSLLHTRQAGGGVEPPPFTLRATCKTRGGAAQNK